MAKKTTKPAKSVSKAASKPAKAPAKSASKSASKPAAKGGAKSAAKASAKGAEKVSAQTKAQPVAKAAPGKKSAADKKESSQSESSRPALMTARGKVKAEVVAMPEKAEVKPKMKAAPAAQRAAPSETSHEFDSNGDQLIAMAKEEMSKINKSADGDKSAEKSSKFKPIKIERGNAADEKAKWQELNKRYGKEKAVAYKMSDSYEPLKPIQHKVLGWGFILTNDNNRLEVLFENSIKMLISNYKAN